MKKRGERKKKKKKKKKKGMELGFCMETTFVWILEFVWKCYDFVWKCL